MEFVARVGTPDGRVVEQSHSASDEEALRSELEKKGLHIFELRRRGAGATSKGWSTGLDLGSLLGRDRRRPVSTERFVIFNQEMAALLRAGLPLLQSLSLMIGRMESGTFRSVLEDVRDRVKTGEDLSDAFAEHRRLFPRLYPSILKAGERSGDLEAVIRRFIRYLKLVNDAKKRVISALIYPAVLIGLSLAMLLIMLGYVVPKFEEFFAASDVQLPLITRALLGIGGFLQAWWYILFPALAVLGFLFWRWKDTDAGRLVIDRWRVRAPLLGPVFHRFALAEFCRSLATLLAGGMPLVPALEIAISSVGNFHVRQRLEPAIGQVRQGRPFHEALEESGVFTDLSVDMVQVGEATGALDEMLNDVSDFLDEQIELRMERILSLVEPLMLVFMGLVIAGLLIALYLPLFGALSQAPGA